MSASAQTMNGAFPPSSMVTLTTRSAACLSSSVPVAVEPVKENFRIRSSASHVPATSAARSVGSTVQTPSGSPASASSPPMASAVNGVSGAGLSSTGQPAASAGAILRAAIAAGKFHGVTNAVIPAGRRRTTCR